MNPVHYTYIPVTIALVLQIVFPYFKNILCMDFWITPHFYMCITVFMATYVLFGILLWKSREIGNDEIFGLTWVLVVLNLIWVYTFIRFKKFSLTLLFLCLLFGYFTYNAIFLSRLSDPDGNGLQDSTTLYINLMSIYIVWIGFMITILIESSSPYLAKEFLKKSKDSLTDYFSKRTSKKQRR
tara:strand:+ start:1095 stop:1643 length:549 start_codon:yes stop_codon:yes gene_type:complete